MANKINNFSTSDVNLTAIMQNENALAKGFHKVSLTNWSTTTVPQVAAGSIVEIDGALYTAESNETIIGSPADGLVYIKSVPSSSIASFEYSTTEPIWNTEKQGWYSATAGEENNRYLNYFLIKYNSNNYNKYINNTLEPYKMSEYKASISVSSTTGGQLYEVPFDTPDSNSLVEYSTIDTRFIAKRSRNVRIKSLIYGASSIISSTGPPPIGGVSKFSVLIKKNGTELAYNYQSYEGSYSISESSCFLSVGDYIEIYIYNPALAVIWLTGYYSNYSWLEIKDI